MNAILLNHTVTSIACQPFTKHLNAAVVLYAGWHGSRHRIELGDNTVDASSNGDASVSWSTGTQLSLPLPSIEATGEMSMAGVWSCVPCRANLSVEHARRTRAS